MKSLLMSSGLAVLLATAAQTDPIRLLDVSDFIWETTPEGVAFAALQGDRFSEPYQALVRLPAGTVSPPHVKSATMYGVMLQGEMIHHLADDAPDAARRIGPGAFYEIKRDTPHVSACVSEIECIAYLYQDGAFDFLPVQP